jgi:hypothetical protein
VASTATVRLCPRRTSGHPHTICHGWPPAAACPPKSRYTVSPFDTTGVPDKTPDEATAIA